MTDFVSIDDMIDARQQAQPGFKKGGQPLTDFKGRNEIAEDAANKYFDDSWPKVISERSYVNKWNKTLDDPKTAIQAWKNKQEAIESDAASDEIDARATDFARLKDIPMNQNGVNKPREKVIGTYDGAYGLEHVDDTEHLDPTASYNGQRDRVVEYLKYGDLKASDPEGNTSESEQEITEDEVKEADTPEGKEDVRVGTEEAAARDDKAKAIEELGKAKDDEEKAAETAYTFDKVPEDPAERAKWEKAMGYDWESMLEGWGIEPTPEIIEEFESAAHPGAYPNIDDLIMRYQRRE